MLDLGLGRHNIIVVVVVVVVDYYYLIYIYIYIYCCFSARVLALAVAAVKAYTFVTTCLFTAARAYRTNSGASNKNLNCKNQALTNGFNQIHVLVDHHQWYAKSLFQHLCSRKAQNEPYGNNKKQQRDFWNRILTLEVLQKLKIALPCCMGGKKNIASHRAWEREF